MLSPADILRTGVVLAALAVASGCGYGSLTSWEPAEESESDAAEGPQVPSLESGADPEPKRACVEGAEPAAGTAGARLMTSYEYANSVRDLLGYSGDVAENFPAENKVNGFENNVDAHVASKLQVREYMNAAEVISNEVTGDGLESVLPCDPAAAGELQCGREFVRSFLERAFRRPPTDAETGNFVDLLEEGHAKWGLQEGVRMVIRAVLQSPQFLYRLQLVDPDAKRSHVRLDDYEMATRLSYFLWATTPDDELLRAAEAGRLRTADQIERHARRMLDDPRARNAVYQFHRQWLHLSQFDGVVKDSERFPNFEAGMTADWHESMRRFVLDAYFGEEGDVEELLTSETIHLTDRLAELYGRDPRGPGIQAYEFEDGRRAGLLTQPSLMALLANANQNSPIRRGVWVRERLLCQHLPPPPADANITPPDPDPNASTRERFREHTANPTCAGCHKLIDPIGFGFLHYDAMGRWRRRENGSPVDASGRLADLDEPSIEGTFDGAPELADRLARSRTVKRCIAKKWFTYAIGRPPDAEENCALRRVQRKFRNADGDFEELLVGIATSEAFRYRNAAPQGDSP